MAQARRLLLRVASQRLSNLSRPPFVAPSFTITRSFTDSKLFVGGLSFRTTEDGLKSAFAVHGEICDVRIITDRETGRSRGFGFVTYYNECDAESALSKLNGQMLDGRTIRVDRASTRAPGGGRAGASFPTLSSEVPEPAQDEDWGTIPSLNAQVPGVGPSNAGSNEDLSSLDGGFGADDGSFGIEQDDNSEFKF